MEENKTEIKKSLDGRLQNILNQFSKCKKIFMNEGEECKNLKEINTKLLIELKEARELEKSHRYHLMSSREMIANLQETVSQLVYLKRDVKKMKDELVSKDSILDTLEKEKENVLRKHNEVLIELRAAHDKEMKDLAQDNNRRAREVQIDFDTQIAQMTFVAEELRNRIKQMENEHQEKMNAVVLEDEAKLQRQVGLRERATKEAEASRAHLHAYRRKLEILEEKVKQSQFKEYLAQNIYTPEREGKAERPYSVETNTTYGYNTPGPLTTQATHSDNKSETNEKKGPFNIVKKRKLYTDKGFLNM
ncbi:MAR-binding filament-like protein 1 [Pieris napi]|uniref:MAR-binding filament-like protein 1 n=1 Tax=Pieris napi TaxID=78633 RepID=UPI001FBB1DAB|nr:MAR-binding filament-like protein 1 [Pieris napi]